MNQILQRVNAPTPPFFKKLRNIGLALTAIAGVILTAPVNLPSVVLTVAGYMAVAGGIAGAVSQLTTEQRNEQSEHDEHSDNQPAVDADHSNVQTDE